MELKIPQLLLFLCMKLLVSGVGAAEVRCIERERQALLKFKESLTGDLSVLTWGVKKIKRNAAIGMRRRHSPFRVNTRAFAGRSVSALGLSLPCLKSPLYSQRKRNLVIRDSVAVEQQTQTKAAVIRIGTRGRILVSIESNELNVEDLKPTKDKATDGKTETKKEEAPESDDEEDEDDSKDSGSNDLSRGMSQHTTAKALCWYEMVVGLR
ncbi:unnamed protein product [Fraxinus pennsylvanica]|uniref:Uncharacterized protein n=1 Tax=Fraxinus pennsylvanica TaxID=56036 RepID=A0AAD2A825_9LAMI|nr:unnamed protein product [Fraxinus pennsylvanica]